MVEPTAPQPTPPQHRNPRNQPHPRRSFKQQVLRRTAHLGIPARLIIAIAAITAGALLILAPLNVHSIAVVMGLGIVAAGIAALLREKHPTRVTRWAGALVIALGAVMAAWPSGGAPWLAFFVGAALVVHGAASLIEALHLRSLHGAQHTEDTSHTSRPPADTRVASMLIAIATLLTGALTFTWPVLTLTLFRFALGAWFVFLGLQLLLFVLLRRAPRTATAPPRPARVLTRWSRTIASALALLLAVGATYGSGLILGGAPLPEPDAFYTADTTVPQAAGQLIRTEPLTVGVPAGTRAWKMLYTTTHPDGSAAVSSGTILAPEHATPDPLPLISVAHGTTGVVAKCAPSLSATPFADGAGTALAEIVSQHGYAAVTSDYIGLGTSGTHPYLVGDAEARNVLDASLAAQQFDELSLSNETVVWGHSQGGQGALWTGQIAHTYAPSITLLGVAAFAPAADLFGLADADKNEAAGKTVSAYIAATWNHLFPALKLSGNLTPGSAGGVAKIENLCFNGNDVLAAILYGTQVPNQVFPDSLLDGAFGDKLKAQTPVGPFPAPVMVAQGLADPLVKPALQHAWVEARCSAGEQIDYRTFAGLDHNSLVAADSPLTPEIVSWTLDRFAAKPASPNCDALPQ